MASDFPPDTQLFDMVYQNKNAEELFLFNLKDVMQALSNLEENNLSEYLLSDEVVSNENLQRERLISNFFGNQQLSHQFQKVITLRDKKRNLERHYQARVEDCTWQDTHSYIVVLTDITEQQNYQLELQKLMEYKDKLLATVSHDLRTPLNSILSSVQAVKNEDALPQSVVQHMDRALRSCQLLNFMIFDILDYSMINSGVHRLVPEETDLIKSIEVVMDILSEQAACKGVVLEWQRGCQFPVFTDARRFQQILLNFLNNSLKFTNSGTISIHISDAQISTIVDKACYNIDVRDSGSGIAPEVLPNLFRMFSTYAQGSEKNKHGVGLGLAICQSLVQELGPNGRGITVTSQLGVGSCFSFQIYKELPLQQLSSRSRFKLRKSVTPQNLMRRQQSRVLEHHNKYQQQYGETIQSPSQNLASRLNQPSSPHSVEALCDQEMSFVEQDYFEEFGIKSIYSNDSEDIQNKKLNIVPRLKINKNIQYYDIATKKKLDTYLRLIKKFVAEEGSKSFLVVDDYPYNILAIQSMFQRAGIQVIGEQSGAQALANIIERQSDREYYQIIFVDINMPEMDGFEVTRQVKRFINEGRIRPLKIVQCSAYTSDTDKKDSFEAGADGFVGKPVTYEAVWTEICKMFLIKQPY